MLLQSLQCRSPQQGPALLLLLLVSLWARAAQPAYAEMSIPDLTSAVIDSGEFFSTSDERRLNERIRALQQNAGPQLQIWTLASLGGEPIESMSLRAVEKWKLGDRERDDGLLLTIARAERRYRLEVGQGLEGVLPDIMVSRLLRKYLIPSLRSGTTASGMLALIDNVEDLIRPRDATRRKRDSNENTVSWLTQTLFNLLLPFLFLLLSFFFKKKRRNRRFDWGYDTLNDSHQSLFGQTRRSSGWGGSWSGGGGGFSGGGASGGW